MGLGSIVGGLVGLLPGVGPIATGLSSAAGALFDANQQSHDVRGAQAGAEAYSSAEALKQREWSSEQAKLNRDWQERLSNTQYQRAMSDMKRAGLNPMLAYSQGGAGVPSGSTASGAAASYPGAVGAQLESARASAASAQAALSQADTAASIGVSTIGKIKQEVVNLGSTNEQVQSVTRNLSEQYQNLIKEGYNLTEAGNQIRATIDKLKAEVGLVNTQQFKVEAEKLLTDAMTLQTGKSNQMWDIDLRAASAFGELGKTTGALRPFLELVWNALVRRH